MNSSIIPELCLTQAVPLRITTTKSPITGKISKKVQCIIWHVVGSGVQDPQSSVLRWVTDRLKCSVVSSECNREVIEAVLRDDDFWAVIFFRIISEFSGRHKQSKKFQEQWGKGSELKQFGVTWWPCLCRAGVRQVVRKRVRD